MNKKICVNCRNTGAINSGSLQFRWDAFDDVRWDSGNVWCKKFIDQKGTQTIDIKIVPDYCPYKLEHLVIPNE